MIQNRRSRGFRIPFSFFGTRSTKLLRISLLLFLALTWLFFGSLTVRAQEYKYAQDYSDTLLKEFDRKLDQAVQEGKRSPLFSKTYAHLLASRELVKPPQSGQISLQSNKSRTFTSPPSRFEPITRYLRTVQKIHNRGQRIYEEQLQQFQRTTQYRSIEPSPGSSGNVSGNAFPEHTWSLTYDDGPAGKQTREIAKQLTEKNEKATFFMLTSQVQRFPETARLLESRKMDIGLHSYTHENLAEANQSTLNYEITKAKNDFIPYFDRSIRLFRLPYGAGLHSKRVREKIVEENMIHVFWNVDSLDWKDPDPESIFERVKKQMKLTPNDAGIILLHDIQNQTVDATRMILRHLRQNDMDIRSVQRVIDQLNQ